MTIERPMFPPRDESNVVKFPFNVADRGGVQSMYRRHRVKREARAREIGIVELTETAKNSRLRDARKTAWHEAETRVEYFHRRMEFECVVRRMQEMGLPEGNSHPAPRDRSEAVRLWREALVCQFLLPAPRNDCVAWKKARLAIGEIERAGMTRERAQNVIDGDIAFLAAHPTKKSKPMSTEAKDAAAISKRRCAGASRILPRRAIFRTTKSGQY
jgi:hypothetical protein